MDKTRQATDEKLAEIEKRLTAIYIEAEAGIREKWDKYLERLEATIGEKQKALDEAVKKGDAAEIKKAKEILQDAIEHNTIMDKKYRDMVAQTAAKLANVNEIALAYVNGEMPPVYVMNYNGIGKDIEKEVGQYVGGYSFDLVDENTVKELVLQNEKLLLPPKKMDIPKDERWNIKNINSQLLQGILQGDRIGQIANRMQVVTDMNRKSAIRNARTMVTAAENRGRLAGMEKADNDGIVLEKQWMSTHDSRTRDSHQMLDGETTAVNKTFSNGLEYPGDPKGAPAEVYNCRCTMVTEIIGFRNSDGTINRVDITRYEPTYFDNQAKKIESANKQPKDFTSVAEAIDFAQIRDYYKIKYDVEVDASVDKLDFTSVKESLQGIETVLNEFPQAKSSLKVISTARGGVMCAGYDGSINFNPGYYDTRQHAISASDSKSNFHPKGNNVISTGAHEMGHILEKAIIDKNMGGEKPIGQLWWNTGEYSKPIVQQACKNAKKTPSGKGKRNIVLMGEVSGYAKTNNSECIAEAVADYMLNGNESAVLSQEIWKLLKGELG